MANLQKALGLSIPSGGRFFIFPRYGQVFIRASAGPEFQRYWLPAAPVLTTPTIGPIGVSSSSRLSSGA